MDWFSVTLSAIDSHVAIAGLMALVTATLIMLCVPGSIIPLSITAGALIDPLLATAAILSGATIGSQLLFLFCRRVAKDRVRQRLGSRLIRFEQQFTRYGLLYLAGLRVIGAPHFLVTGGAALMPMRSYTFALGSILGMVPVIALSSGLGSTLSY